MSQLIKSTFPTSFISSLFYFGVGKKIIMAVSGLLFCLFLVGHLSGNLLLYAGKAKFNAYVDFLGSTNLTYVAEIGLILIILIHIWMALSVSITNRKARKIGYIVRKTAGSSTPMSKYMLHSGIVIAIFLIMHVVSMKFGDWDNRLQTSSNSLYDHVLNQFSILWYSVFHVAAVSIMGMHLHHAIKSAMITIGVSHKSTIELYGKISCVFALVISLGFISFPVYFYILSIIKLQ